MLLRNSFLVIFCCVFSLASFAASPTVSVSSLKFGTLNWTLDTIKRYQLDKKNGFTLNIQSVASPQASKVALLANSANIIVSDWVWPAHQRSNHIKLSFFPYSSSAGALLVANDSDITSVDQLVGKKIGIAGGALDKNWLLLRALANKDKIDLKSQSLQIFAAPPLLNQQIKLGRVDALMTYWHYAARLETAGYRKLLSAHDILKQLGVNHTVPILGYVFKRAWAVQNKPALSGFLRASQQAANLLCHSQDSWKAIIPLTKTRKPATLAALKTGYCAGRISQWGPKEKAALQKTQRFLAQISSAPLLNQATTLDPLLFWPE